jgi:hypothetical protein
LLNLVESIGYLCVQASMDDLSHNP